ncbi:site-specific recombinase XerC [Kineococcus rhizosphaerae]|uniref:Site-specific recombinase XerC n=2 Tax=Kineococcus rhizosphaerae TaxID=559628 RepID=A0A2T0R5Z1_9ACTN|nr:site-specific recombinase XerC [Kineococcus rhizosphaerae]
MAHARRPGGGRKGWLGAYRKADGREATKLWPTKKEATTWANEQERLLLRGEWLDPKSGKVTVGEYADEWLDSKLHIKQTTRENYRNALDKRIIPTWGAVPLSGVTHEGVSSWVSRMHKGGSAASTIRESFVVLSGVLDLAVRRQRIPNNPAKGVSLPSLPPLVNSDRRFLTAEQVWRIADHISAERDRLPFLVLTFTGLRVGELAGLRVRDFDQLKREVRVSRQIINRGGQQRVETPKTASSNRTVPVPPFLVALLTADLAGKGPDDPLVPAPRGGILRTENWRKRVFDPAVRAAEVAVQVPGDTVRLHDLRHTFASLHIQAGTPPKQLSEMMGHSSIGVTLNRYSHLYPGDLHRFADALETAAAAARRPRAEQSQNEPATAGDRLTVVKDPKAV